MMNCALNIPLQLRQPPYLVTSPATTSNGETHDFSWNQAVGMVDLGTLAGWMSFAYAVRNGQVVGGNRRCFNTRIQMDADGREAGPGQRETSICIACLYALTRGRE